MAAAQTYSALPHSDIGFKPPVVNSRGSNTVYVQQRGQWAGPRVQLFDGENIPQGDGACTLTMFCYVLHHAASHTFKLLQEAVDATGEIYRSPLMAAIDRYNPGVMYAAMQFPELPTGAQRRLLENGVIFSGLFGLLRPDDLIPNYRLKMDASVEGPPADWIDSNTLLSERLLPSSCCLLGSKLLLFLFTA